MSLHGTFSGRSEPECLSFFSFKDFPFCFYSVQLRRHIFKAQRTFETIGLTDKRFQPYYDNGLYRFKLLMTVRHILEMITEPR